MIRYLSVLLIMFPLIGCSTKYRVDSYDKPLTRLDNQASFYVVLPTDGRYEETVYNGSGDATARAASTALFSHVSKVVTGQTAGEDLTSALAKASEMGLTHIANITILHWEDRATEWSGIPDKITLRLAVHEVPSGKLISSTVTSASSKWGTFGGDHPQDLLAEPIKMFVDPLFTQ